MIVIDRVHWGPVRFTSRGYRRIQIAVWCTLLIGPAFILAGLHDHSRALIWIGAILLPPSGWLIFQSRRFFAYMIPVKKLEEAKRKVLSNYPHGFFSYECGRKQKLNCFPSRQDLYDVLGRNDGEKLQDWKTEDRVIDSAGREFRIVPRPDKKSYDIEATGETWNYSQLLALAEADARWLKKDPEALRKRVETAPDEKKIPVLMKAVGDERPGPAWSIVAVGLFSLLSFIAIYFGLTRFLPRLIQWLK
jgi:hypothetical protein